MRRWQLLVSAERRRRRESHNNNSSSSSSIAMGTTFMILAALVAATRSAEMDTAPPPAVNLNFYQAGGAGVSGGVQQGDSLVDRLGINNEAFFSSHQAEDEPPRLPGAAVVPPKPGVELVAGEDGNVEFEGDQALVDRVQQLADKQGPSFGTLNFYQAGGPGVAGAEEDLGDRFGPPSTDQDSIDRDTQIFDWAHADGMDMELSWQYE